LSAQLPQTCWRQVETGRNIFGGSYIKIAFASADIQINGVSGQRPDVVSLKLDMGVMELKPQIFGGNGGRCVYLKPDRTNPKEKYLAMATHQLPFRKPKPNKEAVMVAITKFAQEWVKFLKANHEFLYYNSYRNQ
jgi:hypothetical protein